MLSRAIGALALLASLITGGATPFSAAGTQEPTAAVRLLERTPWVTAADSFDVLVAAPGAVTVEATVHDELVGSGGRSRFRTQLAGGDLGPQIGPTFGLTVEGSDRWRLQLPIDDSGAASDDDAGVAIELPDSGVYPVSVRALDADGDELGSLLTHLVRSPSPGTFPALGSVVAVAGPATTATRPDGSVELDARALANTQAVTSAANKVPDVPFLYAATPETIDALGQIELARLARAAVAIPDGPWAGLDLGAWLSEDDLSDPLDHQIERGRDSLDRAELDRSTAAILRAPVTATQRDVLMFAGADVLITSSDLAVGLEAPAVGRVRPALVGDSERPALVVDDGLQAHLSTAGDDPLLAAHHLLTDLAVLFFDRPNDQRAVLLWIDEPGVLGPEALEVLLSGLDGSGQVAAAVEPRDALSTVEPEGALSMARRPPPSLSDYADALAATVAQIRVWDSVLVDGDDRAGELEATLDATAATDVIEQADEWFARAQAIVDAQLTGITIPEQQTVTLTESEAELPIRIDNDLGYEADVLVKLDSTRLEVPEQGPRGIAVRLAPGANDLRIPVQARASGSFPLDVSVSTPRGNRTLAEGRFSVRTTVLNGVGIALTAGSLLVLLVWWGRHFRDGRRDRRLVELDTPTPRHELEGADH